MTRSLLSALFATALLAGCGQADKASRPANFIAANDFESMEGWTPATPTVTTEKAHSGLFSVKIDKDNEFASGYANVLGKVSPTRLQKLTIKGWAMRSGVNAKAAIVVQVVNPATGVQPYWQAFDLTPEVKTFNTWTEVSKTFELPATLEPAQLLKVYLWRTGIGPVYLDDMELLRD